MYYLHLYTSIYVYQRINLLQITQKILARQGETPSENAHDIVRLLDWLQVARENRLHPQLRPVYINLLHPSKSKSIRETVFFCVLFNITLVMRRSAGTSRSQNWRSWGSILFKTGDHWVVTPLTSILRPRLQHGRHPQKFRETSHRGRLQGGTSRVQRGEISHRKLSCLFISCIHDLQPPTIWSD
jgi:hypothetical protein